MKFTNFTPVPAPAGPIDYEYATVDESFLFFFKKKGKLIRRAKPCGVYWRYADTNKLVDNEVFEAEAVWKEKQKW